MADTPETTPAVERAQDAYEKHTRRYDLRAYPVIAREGVQHAVVAALDVEEMARSVADNLYGQDVHTLVMRRPGESRRDQAERIGQWAAEIVLASVLGGAA